MRLLSCESGNILDLGTGTGCLLISLLSENPCWTGTAVDISSNALTVARENCKRILGADRCRFLQGYLSVVDNFFT